jgi:hypothetical protein
MLSKNELVLKLLMTVLTAECRMLTKDKMLQDEGIQRVVHVICSL